MKFFQTIMKIGGSGIVVRGRESGMRCDRTVLIQKGCKKNAKGGLAFSILGVASRFPTIYAPLMKKIVITFIDLPYVLLLRCKYISKNKFLQACFNQSPLNKHQYHIFFN